MKRALVLMLAALLGGCISLFPEPAPPPRLYVLEAGDIALQEGARLDAVVSVAVPTGDRAILGGDLIWRTGDELSFVGQSQWSNRADAALQATLIETLVGQGRFRAAVRAGEARSDYDIRWEVLDFEVDEASMSARFVADVKLLAAPGRRVVAQQIVSAEAHVSARSSSAAAQALARAAREGSARIGEFAAMSVDQARAASINR